MRLDQRLAPLLLAWGPTAPATHQAIGDALGSVRKMVNRLLGNFTDRKPIRFAREHPEIIAAESLRRLASKQK